MDNLARFSTDSDIILMGGARSKVLEAMLFSRSLSRLLSVFKNILERLEYNINGRTEEREI